jgi:predicted dehydrogenase
VKFLLFGLGGIGQRHVRNLRALLGSAVDIIAYRVRGQSHVLTERFEIEPGADLETKYGIRRVASLEAALEERPHAAFICNPSAAHVPVALQAAAAGCHLFIEKPLSDRWDGVDDLAALVERRGLVALVGYQLRFHPCLRQLRQWLAEGRVGPIVSVSADVGEYLPGWHPYEDYRRMYASRRDLGGGVILSQIHELDYLQWLFGAPRRLFALGGRLGRLEIDVEDTASILMECETQGRKFPVHLYQDFLQRPPARTCEVIGEDGRADIDFHALTARVVDAPGRLGESRSFAGFERNQLFLDELAHFLACLRGDASPIVGVSEGARSLRMALAARESIATGQIVELS